jgi:predicted aldo/keto reductase-like oxidoreductase
MSYTHFQDIQLSLIGMGNMRLPTLGEHGPIDETKAGRSSNTHTARGQLF